MIAPALRKLATTALSSGAMRFRFAATPLVVASPLTSTLSFIVTGTPCRGPMGALFFNAASASFASRRALSATICTMEFRCGLTSAIRSKQLCTASELVMVRSLICAAVSVASQRQISEAYVDEAVAGVELDRSLSAIRLDIVDSRDEIDARRDQACAKEQYE